MNDSFIALQTLNVDVRAQGFWDIHHQQAFFDVCIFNQLAATNRCTSSANCFRLHDQQKQFKRIYEQCVCEIERASFIPLVFSALGAMSKTNRNYIQTTSLTSCHKT